MALGVPGRLRPQIISTFVTTRVVGRQPYASTAFTPREIPGTHFQRLSRPRGTWFCRKKSPATTSGIDPETVRLVAQRLNHYATPGPILCALQRQNSATHTHSHTTNIYTSSKKCPSPGYVNTVHRFRLNPIICLKTFVNSTSVWRIKTESPPVVPPQGLHTLNKQHPRTIKLCVQPAIITFSFVKVLLQKC